ncbi:hypothetical protein [Azospirillum brasilense]|uniref:hypothetical protein n=1 Tax=Azospirillum brasilense TaxID=192 RepID=UPI00119D0699|nr:hypothetical protein [Azospirillum brasilense]
MLTLSELKEISGLKPRTLQVWTDAAVLWAEASTDRQGRGVHRRYKEIEAIIAVLIGEVARYDIPVGALLAASNSIRINLEDYIVFNSDADGAVKWYKDDRRPDDCIVFSLLVRQAIVEGWRSYMFLSLSESERRFYLNFCAFDNEVRKGVEEMIGEKYEWPSFDEIMNYTSIPSHQDGRAKSCIMIDLEKALEPIRSLF